ncbi:unnamed protein product, partial [Owenia fusiformis]
NYGKEHNKSAAQQLHAYIIPSGDAHQSEYIAPCDQRRAFISGFNGSAGTAIVTENSALMWTDGRYFLQARKEMDSNWTLMKDGLPDSISQEDWLAKNLPTGGRVGVDPFLIAESTWKSLEKTLASSSHALVPVAQNLIDLVWEDQPSPPNSTLMALPLKYTGMSWQDKVQVIRNKMKEKGAGLLVVTALDDVAYLFNLRGADIEYNPVFMSYALITKDFVGIFIDENKLDDTVCHHLQLNNIVDSQVKVTLYPYDSVKDYVSALQDELDGKVWVSDKSSYALASLVPETNRINEASPVAIMKTVKNETEIKGMKNAHIKDAVALCEFFAMLEKEVPKGTMTEVSAADQLEALRRQQEDFISLSFATISSVGPHGSIIHYGPSAETDVPLTTDQLYLCDSGAQYRDGTTDVTRTMHFGQPTPYEQECFTRVLKGHIALAAIVFPNGVKGHMMDSVARMALWEVGLDYHHGTGHGVGAFLNVHEGPCGIGYRQAHTLHNIPLKEGMILSNEPGYYEDGQFGCRIENLCIVKKVETKYNFKDVGFLGWETITLVPIQAKMLVPSMLTPKEIEWLNSYHEKCRDIMGSALKAQGKGEALEWLMRETEPLG